MEWRSHPGKQELFHCSFGFEVFYGGQAGGGKSDSLLVEAARYVETPGYEAILFRRTFPELERAAGLIPRSFELFSGGGAAWRGDEHKWTFESGATIAFGHMRYEQTRFEYQGAAYAYIGFDELTHFTEDQYRYLFSRARTTVPVPVRVRAASNPGNIGHEWVKERFITPFSGCKPGTIKHFAMVDGVDTEVGAIYPHALTRAFIPASIYDNPTLMAADPSYEARLMGLPLIQRKWLLEGDWDAAAAGNIFDPAWFQTVERAPDGISWARYWDLAVSTKTTADYTASVAVGFDDQGNMFIRDMVRDRWAWHEAREKIAQTMVREEEWFGPQKETRARRRADVRKWNSKPHHKPRKVPSPIMFRHGVEQDIAGRILFQELMGEPELRGFIVTPVPIKGDKLTRALPWSARAEQGRVFLVDGGWTNGEWISAFLNECRQFSGDGLTHDDQIDTVSGGVQMMADSGQVEIVPNPWYG